MWCLRQNTFHPDFPTMYFHKFVAEITVGKILKNLFHQPKTPFHTLKKVFRHGWSGKTDDLFYFW